MLLLIFAILSFVENEKIKSNDKEKSEKSVEIS